ncbi:MAG: hypothetical protein AB8B71_08170, partial [Paracoccaceae bacterium]
MSQQLNIATLPLVLCGPILRRVTEDSVSVFVATKHPRHLILRIYPSTSANETPIPAFEGETETVPLGTHLHVAVVTARAAGTKLSPGTVYGYDVSFEKMTGPHPSIDVNVLDTQPNQVQFGGLGLLDGEMPLGYDTHDRPGFALSPTDIAKVNLLHGSCRKPHGGGPDMLTIADFLL